MTQIELIQLPVIRHDLENVGRQVTDRIEALNIKNLIATEDTIKSLKETRATLNKEYEEYETQRKAVKTKVNEPYSVFETEYKTHIKEKYSGAINMLKSTIDAFELNVKKEKAERLKLYFIDCCDSADIDFVPFDSACPKVDLSTTETAYKKQILAFVDKVKSDLELINSQEFPAEILVMYKQSLDVSASILKVKERKEKEKAEAVRIQMERTRGRTSALTSKGFVYHDLTKTYNYIKDENILVSLSDIESLENSEYTAKIAIIEDAVNQINATLKAPTTAPAPTPIIVAPSPEICKAVFEVFGTMAELMALKEYLINNNLKYENL